MAIASPTPALHPLHRASGSATYTTPSPTSPLTILAAVNSPLEVSRRDELPDAAYIDIHVRPSSNASGGPHERRLEHVLASLLRRMILVERFPRQVVRVTLQILGDEESTAQGGLLGGKAGRDVRLLPALINAAVLALLDAAVPLAWVCVAAWAGMRSDGTVEVDGQQGKKNSLKSVHAMAFTAEGKLVFEESVGQFGMEKREEVVEALRRECVGGMSKGVDDEDAAMEGADGEVDSWLRRVVEEKIRRAGAWREGG